MHYKNVNIFCNDFESKVLHNAMDKDFESKMSCDDSKSKMLCNIIGHHTPYLV